jgi:trk system potassium uptake protein TrkA
MYIIIAGCGRLGKELAVRLSNDGNDIVVIDADTDNLDTLGEGFNGLTVTGMPFDEDVLLEAGIRNAQAVAAVTDDDNVNLMTSEIAGRLYHVKEILTRISEPAKVDTFRNLGFHIICPTGVASECAAEMLNGDKQQ